MKNKIFIYLLTSLVICGWKSDKAISQYKDVFSIYLAKNPNMYHTSEKPKLKDFVLDSIPLLTVDSITSYAWHSHLISFSTQIKHRLENRKSLVDHLFVIVANDERIYWGMFIDAADSYISDSPEIFLPLRNRTSNPIPNGFKIGRGLYLIKIL